MCARSGRAPPRSWRTDATRGAPLGSPPGSSVHRESTGLRPFPLTGSGTYGRFVATFAVTLTDRTVEVIDGADAYQQEGQMTTFFSNGTGRQVVDCWSTRVASFRTSEVVI